MKNRDFQKIFSTGSTIFGKNFILKFIPSEEFDFGISVSKKFFKRATKRNKIKRQVKSIFQEIKLKKNHNLVIVVKQTYNTEEFEENKKQLIVLYAKTK